MKPEAGFQLTCISSQGMFGLPLEGLNVNLNNVLSVCLKIHKDNGGGGARTPVPRGSLARRAGATGWF